MNERDVSALREHFDHIDLSDAIAGATMHVEVELDPMIVTSVRLPKSLLDWVRAQAAAEQLKPTALIRRWIEERRRADTAPRREPKDRGDEPLDGRVARLEALLLRIAAEHATDDDTSEALAALRASVAARGGAS